MNDKELKELNKFKSRSIIKQEKIDKALKEVEEVIKWWESGQAIYLHDNPQGRALMAHVEQIKKILED